MDILLENINKKPQGFRPNPYNPSNRFPSQQTPQERPSPARGQPGAFQGQQYPQMPTKRFQPFPNQSNTQTYPNSGFVPSPNYKGNNPRILSEPRQYQDNNRQDQDQYQPPRQPYPRKQYPSQQQTGQNYRENVGLQERQFRGRPQQQFNSYDERNNDRDQPSGRGGHWQGNRQDNYQSQDQDFKRQDQRNEREQTYQRGGPNQRGRGGDRNQRQFQPRVQNDQNQDRYQRDDRDQRYQRGGRDQRDIVPNQHQKQRPPFNANEEQGQRAPYRDNRNNRDNIRGNERGRGRGRGRQLPTRQFTGQRFPPPPPQSRNIPPKQKSIKQDSEQMQGQQMQSEQQFQSSSQQQQMSEQVEKSEQSKQQQKEESEQQSQQNEQEQSQQQSVQNEQEQSHQPSHSVEVAMRREESSNSINLQKIDVKCSKEEFQERLQTFKLNNRDHDVLRLDTGRSFAIFEINKKTGEPDYALTLKRYRRSTNRSQDDTKEEGSDLPRSRKGLNQTMKHIQKQIMDADNTKIKDLPFPLPPGDKSIQFLHIYDFLWNRKRQMTKDVSRLDIRERGQPQIVGICEQMLRFFIIAVREGRLAHRCRLQFDPKMNLESITKILTQLLEIYESAHNKLQKQNKEEGKAVYISSNQPQIIGYAIIISNDIQNTLNQKLMIRLNGHNLDHPLLASDEIQTALKVKKILKNRDYQAYYRILEDPNTDYVLACLLLHHLPTMRRDALKIIKSSCQPITNTKARRIPQTVFRHALRFKSNQNHQFRQFLKEVRGSLSTESGESFIILQQIDDKLQDCATLYDYCFDQDKQTRDSYQVQKCQKKLSHPQIMSRQQLTKRNWYDGTYSDDVRAYYLGQLEEHEVQKKQKKQKIVQKAAKIVHKEKINIQNNLVLPGEEVAEKVIAPNVIPTEQGRNNMQFLLAKKKQLTRNKFIKSLQGLVRQLIKRSDIHCQHKRKKALQDMLQMTDFMRLITIQSALNRIYEHSTNQHIVQAGLEKLRKYAQMKETFNAGFNRRPYQFDSQAERGGNQLGEMSKLLGSTHGAGKTKHKNQKSLIHNLFRNFREIQDSPDKKIIDILCIIPTSNENPLSITKIQFLKRLFDYLSGDKDRRYNQQIDLLISGKFNDNSILIRQSIFKQNLLKKKQLQYRVKMLNFRPNDKSAEEPFLSGYDSIIYLDFDQDTSPFVNLLRKFKQNKRKILQFTKAEDKLQIQQQLTVYLNVLHLASLQQQWKIRSCEGYLQNNDILQSEFPWKSSWHFLERQSIVLSSTFKDNICDVFVQPINHPLRHEAPQLVVWKFSGVLNLIQMNFQHIPQQTLNKLAQQNGFLLCIQEYFNLCLNFMRKQILMLMQSYEGYDWKEVLLEASYLKKTDPFFINFAFDPKQQSFSDQKTNLNKMFVRKFTFQLQLLQELSMNLTQKYVQLIGDLTDSQDGMNVLVETVQSYLFDLNQNQKDKSERMRLIIQHIIQTNCSIRYQKTGVFGECRALFLFILQQLKIKLRHLTFILPKQFKFQIRKSQLQDKCAFSSAKKDLIQLKNRKVSIYKEIKSQTYIKSQLLQKITQQIRQLQKSKEKRYDTKRNNYYIEDLDKCRKTIKIDLT